MTKKIIFFISSILISFSLYSQKETSKKDIHKIFRDNKSLVNKLAYTTNAKYLVSCGNDATIKVWNATTGTLVRTIKGHKGRVLSVAISPSNRTIVSRGIDNSIKFWDLATGENKKTIKLASYHLNDIAFSSDGSQIATLTIDEILSIYNVKDGRLIHEVEGHSDFITSLAYSPTDNLIATASYDNTIKIWNSKSGKREFVLRGHNEWVKDVVYGPHGRMIASGSSDKTVKIWDAETGMLLNTLRGHKGPVNCIDFSPDGRFIASGGNDKNLIIWDVETGEKIREFMWHSRKLVDVAFNPNGKYLVSSSLDNTLVEWDVRSLNIETRESFMSRPIYPAELLISKVKFLDGNGNNILESCERGKIQFTVKNIGKGEGQLLELNMNEETGARIFFKPIQKLGNIQPNEELAFEIPIKGKKNIKSYGADFVLDIVERNGYNPQSKNINIRTKAADKSDLRISEYAFKGAYGVNVRVGNKINLKITVKNGGNKSVNDVKVQFFNPINVFSSDKSVFTIDELKPNEQKIIVYSFLTSRYYKKDIVNIRVKLSDRLSAQNRDISVDLARQ